MENIFSTIILASGLSERMGEPKALLKWDNSTAFLEKIIKEYINAGCTQINCMVNPLTITLCEALDLPKCVKLVVNPKPELGRFSSIRIAAQEVKNSNFCFIQNVDNPFVSADIIEKIWKKRDSKSWCSPIYSGKGGHPVLISQVIIEQINKTQNLDITLHDILKPFQRINIEVNTDAILRNINTPEEYSKYFANKV
ncbi:MAG: NTP transferase domain-containing protein [Bacteroidota bacterium]